MLKSILLTAGLVFLGGCTSIERLAIPKSKLISPSFTLSGTEDTVAHASWSRFLCLYTQKDSLGVVRLDYAAVPSSEHEELKAYIASLTMVDPAPLSKNAQLAYWANLYNAATVDVILDHYPVESIRDVTDGVFDLGPWEDKRLLISGRPTSLHDIEHGIVRAVWRDTPEIHYILNCASTGCPNLPQTAHTGDTIELALRDAAISHVNDAIRGVRVDSKGRVHISKIYAWYLGDFGGSEAHVLDHLRHHAKPDLKAKLEHVTTISSYFYDWSLNDTNL